MSEDDERQEEIRRAFTPEGERLVLDLFKRLSDRVEQGEAGTQKKIDFILDQQAQFTSDIQKLQEFQAQFASDIQKLQESQAALVEAQVQTNALVTRLAQVTTAGFNELRESVSAVATAQVKSEERIAALADAQAHTDGRLNVLITTVERFISESHNGKS